MADPSADKPGSRRGNIAREPDVEKPGRKGRADRGTRRMDDCENETTRSVERPKNNYFSTEHPIAATTRSVKPTTCRQVFVRNRIDSPQGD